MVLELWKIINSFFFGHIIDEIGFAVCSQVVTNSDSIDITDQIIQLYDAMQ